MLKFIFFFFNDTATTEIYTLSLHDALPICEEILFRGALQPRLGLMVTALLFTSVHTQYSISFDTLTVFVLALGLGLIRKYTNTTTSAITHATFNLIGSIGLTSQLLGFAIGV